jgi:hypothetical protein
MAGILFEPSGHLAILAMPRSKEQNNCPLHLSGSAEPIPAKINHPWPYAKHFFKGSGSRCRQQAAVDKRLTKTEKRFAKSLDELTKTIDKFLKRLTDIEEEFTLPENESKPSYVRNSACRPIRGPPALSQRATIRWLCDIPERFSFSENLDAGY